MNLSPEDLMDIPEQASVSFATVTEIGAQGMRLLIDGETQPTQKYYKRISAYSNPIVGDRVYFQPISGTILVMGAIK